MASVTSCGSRYYLNIYFLIFLFIIWNHIVECSWYASISISCQVDILLFLKIWYQPPFNGKSSLGVHIHIPYVHESTLIDALSTSCSHTRIRCACVHVSFLLCRVYKNLTCLLSATEAPCLFPHPPNGRLTPSPRGGKTSRRRGRRDDGG